MIMLNGDIGSFSFYIYRVGKTNKLIINKNKLINLSVNEYKLMLIVTGRNKSFQHLAHSLNYYETVDLKTNVRIQTHTHRQTHARAHTHTHTHTHTFIHFHAHARAHTHARTHTQTLIDIHS